MATIISGEKTPETSEAKALELPVSQPATPARSHCMWARARVPIDAPVGQLAYARMFPELPSFRGDEEFLRALGRVGGVCDCGNIDDSADSLGDTAAGWPILGQFVAHDITADRSAFAISYQHGGLTQCPESATQS